MSQQPRQRRAYQRRKPIHQIIIAKGDEVRSFSLHGWMIGTGIVMALAITFWLFAATAYVVFRDDVLAGMIARQTRQQHAYEDRIAALRLSVDRVTSRQLLDQEAFTARLDDLITRQNTLQKRSSQVSSLVDKAKSIGVKLGDDDLVTGSLANDGGKIVASARIGDTLTHVEQEVGRIGRYQDNTLVALEQQMASSEKTVRGAAAELGVTLENFAAKKKTAGTGVDAQGGPYIPLRTNYREDFQTRANYVIDQMDWLGRLRNSMGVLPLHRPVSLISLSSPFGGRFDPFTGRSAFHSGLDFRGSIGSPVKATAPGIVTKAGRLGGYGNLVEIKHSNGFSTRYGHLSQIIARVGQRVNTGDTVGALGSTGRSTGPHLHYETRLNGQAINPMRFVKAGQKLNLW